MNFLGLWEVLVDQGIIMLNIIEQGRGGRGEVSVNLGRILKVGRRVQKILVIRRRRQYRGGGEGGLRLMGINVSQAVVEMGVGVVVDLGSDNGPHERRVIWYARQGTPATRGPWWKENFYLFLWTSFILEIPWWEESSCRAGSTKGRMTPGCSVRLHI